MEVPSIAGQKKSPVLGAQTFDRKTLIKKGMLSNKQKEDNVDGFKTKYELEKDTTELQNNPNLVQTLLDSSTIFRSRTALPHGLLFDLYIEVYQIVQDLLKEYLKCSKTCIVLDRNDSDMDELIEDTKKALSSIGKHIGKSCDGKKPDECSTNRIYADVIAGIFHNISSSECTNTGYEANYK